jgi:hypothetical protein
VPPERSSDDVEVLLVDEAWHKGLVLRSTDGALVEWGFGAYGWYALERNEWYHVLGTVLWPVGGTLSRRAWSPEERGRRAAEDVHAFHAPRARVEALARALQAEFDAASGAPHWSEPQQTHFARSDTSYWMFHDCHDQTAEWLEGLGCTVEPALVRTGIRMREPNAGRD